MLDRRIHQQNLLLCRNPPHFSQSRSWVRPPRPQTGRRRHDPPPELRRIRVLLSRSFHGRSRHHHRQPLLHFGRNFQAVECFQGENRRHAGAVRRQAPGLPRRTGGKDRRRFHRHYHRRSAGELHAFLGGVGGERERTSGGFDQLRRPSGAAVLLWHYRASEGGGPDAQELDHKRGSAGGRREP